MALKWHQLSNPSKGPPWGDLGAVFRLRISTVISTLAQEKYILYMYYNELVIYLSDSKAIQNPVPRGVRVRLPPPAPAKIAGSVKSTARGTGACISGSPGVARSAAQNDNRTALSCWHFAAHPGCSHRHKLTSRSENVPLMIDWLSLHQS